MPAPNSIVRHYDAIVVGARCAGAATAMLLARLGARVLMIDSGRKGSDTMSTHALMRGAVMQLSSWGVLERLRDEGTPAIRKTAFIYGDEAVEIDIKPSHGVDALYAPRRFLLDEALVDAAIEAGVETRFDLACEGLLRRSDGRVRGVLANHSAGATFSATADLVVGADGRHSTVAHHAGARMERQAEHATAVVYGYFDGVADRGNRWYYAPGLAAGVIPTNGGQACVFVSMPRQIYLSSVRSRLASGLHSLTARFPELRTALAGAQLVGRPVGFIGQEGHMRQASGPGWALVGDAGYFKDPLTAHGITDALRDAEILAHAIVDGRLDNYQRARDALSRDLFAVTDEIAAFDWTIDELKSMHLRLNRAMKEEQDWMLSAFARRPLAA